MKTIPDTDIPISEKDFKIYCRQMEQRRRKYLKNQYKNSQRKNIEMSEIPLMRARHEFDQRLTSKLDRNLLDRLRTLQKNIGIIIEGCTYYNPRLNQRKVYGAENAERIRREYKKIRLTEAILSRRLGLGIDMIYMLADIRRFLKPIHD